MVHGQKCDTTGISIGTALPGGWYCGQHLIEGGTTFCNYWYTEESWGPNFAAALCAPGSATAGTCIRPGGDDTSVGLDVCSNIGTCADLIEGSYCGYDTRVQGMSNIRYYCDGLQAKPLYGMECGGQNNKCIIDSPNSATCLRGIETF